MMHEPDESMIRDSKKLSRILRHRPADFHVTLDARGWTTVEGLSRGSGLPAERILEIAENNTRYELSDDGLRIRALHGHSVPVEYDDEVDPPDVLYHGTSRGNLELILEIGAILPMGRTKVHLSSDTTKAKDVGRRHGEPVVIFIDARRMRADRRVFHLSRDGVYLVDRVPSE